MQESKQLSGITLMAIEHFWKIIKVEKKAEKMREELNTFTKLVPQGEMELYILRTTEID